jgi:general L-amino acid transport system permease protein
MLALTAALLAVAPAVAVVVATGATFTLVFPEVGRFNIRGGLEVLPELVALVTGLVIYTAAFIAEVVRAGIMAVPRGQSEAARALGLRRGTELRLIIVPQAMRVIIPPLTNQYLNLTKNSSLAVAIGYPDLVQIFAGTVLNVTGQAVEVVIVTMGVYLVISLLTSAAMNLYDARIAVAERR